MGVLRKILSSPTTSVPLLVLITVMLDMSVIFDRIEYDDKGTELSMFLSESTERVLKVAVVILDSFICGGKKKIQSFFKRNNLN